MTNCPNCGAPIESVKCAYCGTVFDKPNKISRNEFMSSLEEINLRKRIELEELESRVQLLKADIITTNEARRLLGLEPVNIIWSIFTIVMFMAIMFS